MKSTCLVLLLIAPFTAQAADGVQAALQAARALWPAATITASIATAPCPAIATADAPGSPRNGITQVRVRCDGTPGWTRYIALQVAQTRLVAVLRTPLAHGQPLKPEAIDWQSRDALRLPADALAQSDTEIPVLTARRDLPAGSVLVQSQFTAPKAVERGQRVMLISRAAGMEVRAPGEALADAASGARVRVRNSASHRIVEGIAQPDGSVEVTL